MATSVTFLTQNPVQENTYLVYDTETRETIVFDPGCYTPEEERELVATIERLDLKPVQLINTHCHFDHVFGNAFVVERYGLELGIHPLEQQILEAAPMFVQTYGMPPMTPSPAPGYFIHEGDTVMLGQNTFAVLFCPGHSPGSLCFYNAAESYVIAGDVLFRRSIGRTDLPLGDHDTLIGSILTKLMPLPDETVVYPGHGPSTTIGEERRENPFL
ncbi:MBL fold metallo-hydrolase [Neolewinella sp.]|uniref:MBL fold metallo-hydrolase n=1 Tax=Neolewinella sp. TaxID=2993543 RepID=UPI003B52F268